MWLKEGWHQYNFRSVWLVVFGVGEGNGVCVCSYLPQIIDADKLDWNLGDSERQGCTLAVDGCPCQSFWPTHPLHAHTHTHTFSLPLALTGYESLSAGHKRSSLLARRHQLSRYRTELRGHRWGRTQAEEGGVRKELEEEDVGENIGKEGWLVIILMW